MKFTQIFLYVLQFTLSFALVIAVLLHSAKGEGLAGIGGQAHIFGSQKGVEAGLNRITAIIAVLWFLVAGLLALLVRNS
ncbi:MAG: preprotein translocase subunit SecG [Cyanobacteria bacterium NC_groundwater_1444_Ag_S-0.65um_54_12]|nr:preprotein translocase subunit SecG [Cyanobacteria bacterium NC_groundwater_1444_Ag_S-0.65um_54_12]